MNCKKCHHARETHESSLASHSLSKLGKCSVPTCLCREFVEPIDEIDEELV